MSSVKKIIGKHRYSIFYFVFLVLYNHIIAGQMRPWSIHGVTYSFHAVDFSIGFCTRILPGAIYNFLFDTLTREAVTHYGILLTLLCFLLVSLLLEKLMNGVEETERKTVFLMTLFFVGGPFTFSVLHQGLLWFDFYWLFGAVIFFWCLSKKHLYPFIIPIFFCTILVYYSSILCYVPMFVIIMLYKISCTKEKKDKVLLWLTLAVSFVLSMGLFFYMLLFELENVKYTYEELSEILKSRGVNQLSYYYFAFYRDTVTSQDYIDYMGEAAANVMTVDSNVPVIAFFQMVIQQIQINYFLSNHEEVIATIILCVPIVAFVIKCMRSRIKQSEGNRLKQFALLCSVLLFFVTTLFGLLFSTDTIRWIAMAFIPLFAAFLYMLHKEDVGFRVYVKEEISKINVVYILPYLWIFFITRSSI